MNTTYNTVFWDTGHGLVTCFRKTLYVCFQNIPTLGTVAVTMALHNCDEVAVAGFGYNLNTPHAPLHYYEKVSMSAIKEVTKDQGPYLPSVSESLLG